MPKSSNTTPAYNALFQEHTAPTIGKNKRTIVDTGQSCHVFAIVSAPNWETRDAVNKKYETIGTEKAMRRLQLQINHDLDEEDKKREDPRYVIQPYPRLTPEEIREERMFNMGEILKLRTEETVLPVENMFLCGGFRRDDLVPEHMWIEDHTNNRSYDTFINRGGIAVVNKVGKEGLSFKPGCEGSSFRGNEIGRIKVDGYTYGQLIAIAAGAEDKDKPFPDSIANTPQVLMAIETVKLVNEALAKIPGPVFTKKEAAILKKVGEDQKSKGTDKERNEVITNLTGDDKDNFESAMAKYAEVGRQQREAALAIVGTSFHPFVKLSQELNAIKPDQIATQITKAISIEEATRLKTDSLEELRKLEEKKGTLPNEEFKEKFQQKIDEARIKIESAFATKEREPLDALIRELNDIKPEDINKFGTLKGAHEKYEEILNKIVDVEEKQNTLPDKFHGELQEKIETLKQQAGSQLDAKIKVREMVEQIRSAATNYLEWSKNNASGFRFSFLSHGSYGREQAQKLLDMINNQDTPMANILKVANETVNTSGTNKNSFSRYLHDALHDKKEEKIVGEASLAQKFKDYKNELNKQLSTEIEKEVKNTEVRM